ncbi:MAG TPA: hypothetical protein VEV43_02950 [Actinomycetota bacterium]|nr:hypothetical protein [Actinomycetota bacterium]
MAEAKRRRREYWAGFATVMAATAVLFFRWWPVPQEVEGSFLDAVVQDPVMVGALRLTIFAGTLYALASIPALVVGGRWARSVGTAGFVADEAQVPASVEEADRTIANLRVVVSRLLRERDELLSLMEAETNPD